MTDWSLTYNGLQVGANLVYRLDTLEGFHDLPEVRTSDLDRARSHGQFAGVDMLGGRQIRAAVNVVARHPNSDLWDAFSRALVAGMPEAPLIVQLPGVAGGREVQVNARVRRLKLHIDRAYRVGAGKADVEWWCTDPRIYDAESATVDAAMADVSGTGRTYPRVYPLTYGGAISGGLFTTNNEGEFPAPWTATMTGPVTNPRLENVTTGQTIRFSGSLASGETLYLSSDEKAVLLNGTASRYYWLAAGSEWFDLAPGVNDLRFAGTAGAGSIQLEFRSAWI